MSEEMQFEVFELENEEGEPVQVLKLKDFSVDDRTFCIFVHLDEESQVIYDEDLPRIEILELLGEDFQDISEEDTELIHEPLEQALKDIWTMFNDED
jgi:hypothetical protein